MYYLIIIAKTICRFAVGGTACVMLTRANNVNPFPLLFVWLLYNVLACIVEIATIYRADKKPLPSPGIDNWGEPLF